MTMPQATHTITSGSSEEFIPLYARTQNRLLVAKVGDNAFAMIPRAGGGYYLASGWRLSRPMAQWTRADFYGHGGELADEVAFRTRVEENAEHRRQSAALGRRRIDAGVRTPWGLSQHATFYAEGVVAHSTAGHGGFHLDRIRNARVHPALRAADGWYESHDGRQCPAQSKLGKRSPASRGECA